PTSSASPTPSASPTAPVSTTPPVSATTSPSTSPSTSSSTATTTALLDGGTDNASYSVASTFDTVPMANQSGRIAVTLTNTGTSTWTTGYGLGALVFPSGDTTGTGTPLTTGPVVSLGASVVPGAAATAESVTPAETPGSYEICWDMVSAS